MWSKAYSVVVKDIEPEQVWKVWSDFSKRTQWDDDTEWVEAKGPFEKGTIFYFKPQGGSKLKMVISECIPNQVFTDSIKLFLARLSGIHAMEKTTEGLRITTTIEIVGPLWWLWKKIVGDKIVATLPHQTDLIIKLAREESK